MAEVPARRHSTENCGGTVCSPGVASRIRPYPTISDHRKYEPEIRNRNAQAASRCCSRNGYEKPKPYPRWSGGLVTDCKETTRISGTIVLLSGGESFPFSWGRVALLGIAQRQIRIEFKQKPSQRADRKPLPSNIQTIGDWIKVKRAAKNLAASHLAAKMGIAHAVVRSWEDGSSQPDSLQLKELETMMGAKPDWLG